MELVSDRLAAAFRHYAGYAMAALLGVELLATTGIGLPHARVLLVAPAAADTLRWFAPIAACWLLAYGGANTRARELLGCIAAAAVIGLVSLLAGTEAATALLIAFDAAALLTGAHTLLLSRSAARGKWARALLWLYLLFAALVLLLQQLANFTVVLHAFTHDTVLYRLDGVFGLVPDASLARFALALPAAAPVLATWHPLLIAAPCLLLGASLRGVRQDEALAVLRFVLIAGVVLCMACNLYPAAGPAATFQKFFPAALPALQDVPLERVVLIGAARVALPALHFSWAMGLVLLTWRRQRKWRTLFCVVCVLDVLIELALGKHYLIDLVVTMPLTLALVALVDCALPWKGVRAALCMFGAAVYALWLLLLTFAPELLIGHALLAWLLVLLSVAACVAGSVSLLRAGTSRAAPDPMPAVSAAAQPWLLYGMFSISGAAALVYQVVFSKQLTYVFGSMSTATNTVLATYMGGMALGAWLGGVLAPRLRRPVVAYAVCELLIAIYCAASPLVFKLVLGSYVALASGAEPDAPGLLPLRVLLGGIGLIIPTILMGLTLPILARFFEQRREALGLSVGRLYAANTLGASSGALLAGYWLLPLLGVRNTTLVAVAANLLVAGLGMRFQRLRAEQLSSVPAPAAGAAASAGQRELGWIALLILGCGGFVTLALEVDFIHLLAVSAGNSTYAFSLMLCAFLVGLGGGAEAGRWLLQRIELLRLLAWLEFGLCATILIGVMRMNAMPDYFGSFEHYPIELGWSAREAIRGLLCCLAMLPPALFIGAIFPVAIECIGRGFPRRPIRMLGFASALNTVGNILGVLVAGFVLLPAIGPLHSIRLLAGVCLMLGLVATLRLQRRWDSLLAAGVGALWLTLLPPTLDYDHLTTGANVYFSVRDWGHVIDRAESLDGGLTTVNELRRPGGERLLTLLTNGKFQGTDAPFGEMVAQIGFAMAPLLHNDRRESALVIGYGTGITSRVMHDAGFAQLDIVDLSADVLRLANRHMHSINAHVTEKPGVKTFVTDGRNFLLLSRQQYDVISMEISSIWFAGAASLYNREFYRLASTHLHSDGVLQQWMQIHHMAPSDLLYILGSVRAEFRYVWLYVIGDQGIVVATNSAQAVPSEAHVAAIDGRAEMHSEVAHYGGSAARLIDSLLLDPDGIDRLLGASGVGREHYVSNDDNAHLEYSTPKGNALDAGQTMETNMAMLKKFSLPAFKPPQ